MKRAFYAGVVGLMAFEFLKVYLIMPLPGSQRMDSLDLAYFLHRQRWVFRSILLLMVALGARGAFRVRRKWRPCLVLAAGALVAWILNFQMTAERIFRQPEVLTFAPMEDNKVDPGSVAVVVEKDGETKAYPIRFLVYHHQVRDIIAGTPVIITYCSVCRTGRVFEPRVDGRDEAFRLVGMDHFNAMLEDAGTGSWWRQATGEAVVGPLKGRTLPEIPSRQMSLRKIFELHSDALVMQPEGASAESYDTEGKYERGESRGKLTGTDPQSWGDKSWVVGIEINGKAKAYDWNRLVEARVINDQLGGVNILIVLAEDGKSFAAFRRPAESGEFSLNGDTLVAGEHTFDFAGRGLSDPSRRLDPLPAFQEFWHSWRTFHPWTTRD